MPRDTFNINEDHLDVVLRVKRNQIEPITQPKRELGLVEWFEHIKNSLRDKNTIIIK